jgi:hypothetical protein
MRRRRGIRDTLRGVLGDVVFFLLLWSCYGWWHDGGLYELENEFMDWVPILGLGQGDIQLLCNPYYYLPDAVRLLLSSPRCTLF